MDLLEEIKRLKVRRQERKAVPAGNIENPLPRWEKVWSEVSGMIRTYCVTRRVTFGELVEECRAIDPACVSEFYRLWELLDCDVFGRWVENRLTDQGLKAFYALVERWKEAARNLIALHEHGGSILIRR